MKEQLRPKSGGAEETEWELLRKGGQKGGQAR